MREKKTVLTGPTPREWPGFMREPEAEPPLVPTEPGALIRYVFRTNWKLILVSVLIVALSYTSTALLAQAVGEMLDAGIDRGITTQLIPSTVKALALILVIALTMLSEPVSNLLWLRGTWVPMRRLVRTVFMRRTDVSKELPSGDIVTTVTTDGDKIGMLLAFVPDAVGSFIAFIVAAYLMLRVSVPLGLFVVIGLPILMVGITFIVKPMQKKIAEQREEQGKLTTLASDAVVGLRVLRGVGGEDVYNAKYRAKSEDVMQAGFRVAVFRATLYAIQTAGPALFTAVVVGGGLLATYEGAMSPGDLFAFYGYTAFLSMPISSIGMTIQVSTRGWVGAKKLSRILSAQPLVSDEAVGSEPPHIDWQHTSLTDATSGVRVEGGKLTALVSLDPAETLGIATRLTRVDDADTTYAGDIDLRSVPIDEVRRNIVLSGAIAELFTGTLRSGLLGPEADDIEPRDVREQIADIYEFEGDSRALFEESPGARPIDSHLHEALEVADAHDVLSSVRGGLDGNVAERGRSLSGGQRQRVALARAVAHRPAVAVLIEPTSAVDSHTESRIAERLASERAGATTVIVTSSPLVLDRCDEVVLVNDGHEVARGKHRDMLKRADYFAVVHRESGDEEEK
ncbi:ABC transporter ATP-binding protein [Arcanobacterium haemolyticum]|nr:ABC transporter ATP-binding protein [Arcanobacterium haemolyticum]